jgi:hypothetical protein
MVAGEGLTAGLRPTFCSACRGFAGIGVVKPPAVSPLPPPGQEQQRRESPLGVEWVLVARPGLRAGTAGAVSIVAIAALPQLDGPNPGPLGYEDSRIVGSSRENPRGRGFISSQCCRFSVCVGSVRSD